MMSTHTQTTREHQNNFALDVVRFVVVRNIIGIYSSIVRWVFDVIVPAMLQCPALLLVVVCVWLCATRGSRRWQRKQPEHNTIKPKLQSE